MSFRAFLRRHGQDAARRFEARFSTTPPSSTPKTSAGKQQQKQQSWFEWYSDRLETHPLTTKCITAGIISSTGNVVAQRITYEKDRRFGSDRPATDGTDDNVRDEQPFRLDLYKTGCFASLNIFMVTPILHYWYQYINAAVPGSSLSSVLQRVFWDEFVFTPAYIPVVMGTLWTLEGTPFDKVWNMVKNESLKLVMAEWVVWVPTMFLTFRYIPVKFQVLTINLVGVFWSTCVSLLSTQAHKNEAAAETSDAAATTSTTTEKLSDDKEPTATNQHRSSPTARRPTEIATSPSSPLNR